MDRKTNKERKNTKKKKKIQKNNYVNKSKHIVWNAIFESTSCTAIASLNLIAQKNT